MVVEDSDKVYCRSCGELIKYEAEICPQCGVRQKYQQPQPAQPLKNPGLAAVASTLFTGLGQIYNGQIIKGILLIIVQFISVLLLMILIGFITTPIIWIYAIYDAYKTAEKINAGEVV